VNLQLVIMQGADRLELPLLRAAAEEYGWPVQNAGSVNELLHLRKRGKIGAVLFHKDSLGRGGALLGTILQLKNAAPEARLIACNHFSETADYPKLCRAGLFHALWLPLKESEVRQCLGFIWEAEKHSSLKAEPGKIRFMRAAS
jgi:DNA-binding NtrC family response regulator